MKIQMKAHQKSIGKGVTLFACVCAVGITLLPLLKIDTAYINTTATTIIDSVAVINNSDRKLEGEFSNEDQKRRLTGANNRIFQGDAIECMLSEARGLQLQTTNHSSNTTTPLESKWLCITDTEYTYELKGDMASLYRKNTFLMKKNTKLSIPANITQGTDEFDQFVDLDSEDASSIKAVSNRVPYPMRLLSNDDYDDDYDYYDDEWDSDRFKGSYKILVVRVVDANDNSVAQSEERLYNDFFEDENNLRERYLQCSDNQLEFEPATGSDVNNGVLTIELQHNIANKDSFTVRNLVMMKIYPMIGDTIDDDMYYIMMVMPNTVDFDGAVAWSGYPNRIISLQSMVASLPMVQGHEMGHALDFSHSGKVVTGDYWEDQTKDPTCIMGYEGLLTDSGSAMCFSGSKTWYTGWYDDYHQTVKPHMQQSFQGDLVGIDDVVNGLTDPDKHTLVLRVKGPNEKDLHIMYQRQKGVIQDLEEDGDTVVVTEQARGSAQSWSRATLGEGDIYRVSRWNGGVNSLIVQVCQFIMGGSPDKAHILVYIENKSDINCKTGFTVPTPSPTQSPVPTSSPTQSPVPTSSPTQSPVPTSSPTQSPVPTSSPTKAPTSSLTKSPVTTSSPTKAPSVSPSTSYFTENPTLKTNTEIPTSSDTDLPTNSPEQLNARFYLKNGEDGEPVTKSCFWLQQRPDNIRTKKICTKRWYQKFSEAKGLRPASLVCFETCADYCVWEYPKAVYLHGVREDEEGNEVPITKTCQWLSKRPELNKMNICNNHVDFDTVYGQASQICTTTCNSCDS